jgi:hypothetical protein
VGQLAPKWCGLIHHNLHLILKKVGFKELRSHVYPLNIELVPGRLFATWVKDRSSGNRELKSRFKSLSLNAPLFNHAEDHWRQASEWSKFSYKGTEALGLGAAYLASSLVVSFPTSEDWQNHEVTPVHYEYFDTDEIVTEDVSVRNISYFRHVHHNKEHCLERSKKYFDYDDWEPEKIHLPNAETANNLLKISAFYKYFQTINPQRKVAEALLMGEKVAELNQYSYEKRLSKLNTTANHIRQIYASNNPKGKKTYLSIDVEKGAFEVCDYQGVHQREILFNGEENGGQELDHSIRLK